MEAPNVRLVIGIKQLINVAKLIKDTSKGRGYVSYFIIASSFCIQLPRQSKQRTNA